MTDPRERPCRGADPGRLLGELAAVERRGGTGGGDRDCDGTAARFTVETDTVHGMHAVVAITAPPVPGGGAAPPPGEAQAAVLRSLVRSLLDLAGHGSGRASTTVALGPGGPHVLACRLGTAADGAGPLSGGGPPARPAR